MGLLFHYYFIFHYSLFYLCIYLFVYSFNSTNMSNVDMHVDIIVTSDLLCTVLSEQSYSSKKKGKYSLKHTHKKKTINSINKYIFILKHNK